MTQEMKLSIRLSSLMLAQWQQCHGEDEAEVKEVETKTNKVGQEVKDTAQDHQRSAVIAITSMVRMLGTA